MNWDISCARLVEAKVEPRNTTQTAACHILRPAYLHSRITAAPSSTATDKRYCQPITSFQFPGGHFRDHGHYRPSSNARRALCNYASAMPRPALAPVPMVTKGGQASAGRESFISRPGLHSDARIASECRQSDPLLSRWPHCP